jgi:lipoprotein LprG
MNRVLLRALLLWATAGLLLSACDLASDSAAPTAIPTPSPIPTPTPTPAEISAQVGQATQGSQSFHFDITLSGKPVFVDTANTFAVTSIVGDLKRPDGVLATLKLSASGGVSEIKSVSLAGKQYITNPITLAWQCVPPGATFDPAVLFDPNKGFEHLLQKEFKDVRLVGTEELAGTSNFHLTGSLPGPALKAISSGLLGTGDVQADLWADTATMRASQLLLADSSTDASNPTTWKIVFSEYDKAVDVQAPPGAQC